MFESILQFRRARRAAFACFALAAGFAAASIGSGPAAAKKAIAVVVDQAKLVRIESPAATVIVGNPAIADATVYDANTLVITGKSFGTTNLIVLDAKGEPIADELLSVSPARAMTVQIHRRAARYSFSCDPTCAPTLTPGDNQAYYDTLKTQLEARHKMSKSSATGDN